MSETIQRTKLYEDVTERMLDHIRTETWAPGTKIPPEVELAKLFDVSRCTIREAVKSLQIAGFLRSRAGSGTFVSERAPTLLQTQALAGIMADPAALRELVQARYILEPQLAQMAALGLEYAPVCIAKTQYSLSDNAKLLGRPQGHALHIRGLTARCGAGFAVALAGSVLTMPGLPAHPAAMDISLTDDGRITGLF